jgi:predicted MFS family arabinose efflux permease
MAEVQKKFTTRLHRAASNQSDPSRSDEAVRDPEENGSVINSQDHGNTLSQRSMLGEDEEIVKETSANVEVPMYVMYVICLIAFMDWLSTSMSNPVIPFWVKKLGGTEADVGCIYSLAATVTVLLMPSFGRLADLYGRKPVIIMALACNATGQFLSAFAPSLVWYYVFQSLAGVGPGSIVAIQTYISDVSLSAETRAYWFAQITAYPAIALGLGFPIGG